MDRDIAHRFGLLATIEYGLTAYADQDGMDEHTRAEVLAGLAEVIEQARALHAQLDTRGGGLGR